MVTTPDAGAHGIAAMLRIEQLDDDLFRGSIPPEHANRHALFGGQVAAQGLMAAGRTVPDGRFPHSLHGYFVRSGRIDHPVILRVERDRDGRSFSVRHVSAIQDGEVIFELACSFHLDEEGGSEIDELPLVDPMPSFDGPESYADPLVDVREVTRMRVEDGKKYLFPDRMWLRSAAALPDDRLTHACALAYLSDYGSGFGQLDDPNIGVGGPSLDHVVWFHDQVRADNWLLADMRPLKARGVRGVYQATLRAADGTLGALVAQECLIRPNPVPGSPDWPIGEAFTTPTGGRSPGGSTAG
jgi:acyl-CoA thioesterase-2